MKSKTTLDGYLQPKKASHFLDMQNNCEESVNMLIVQNENKVCGHKWLLGTATRPDGYRWYTVN